MAKKAAVLSDNLLVHRPRKGEAKPQTEADAVNLTANATQEPAEAIRASKGSQGSADSQRRRRRRSNRIHQLNFRVSDEYLNQFTKQADREEVTFAVMFERILDQYLDKKK